MLSATLAGFGWWACRDRSDQQITVRSMLASALQRRLSAPEHEHCSAAKLHVKQSIYYRRPLIPLNRLHRSSTFPFNSRKNSVLLTLFLGRLSSR